MPVPQFSVKWNGPTTCPTNAPYAGGFATTGGVSPYTFSVGSGALPDGISLDRASGKLTGIPRSAGNFNFAVKVKDAAGSVLTTDCLIVVSSAQAQSTGIPPGSGVAAAPQSGTTGPPSVAPLAAKWEGPTSGDVGKPYAGTIVVGGGTKPYSFARETGVLPEGLSLDRASGKIAGTPRDAGHATYSVTVADADGSTVAVNCPITINA